ncbi:glycoside hydrolase family 28 protein [Collybiopsis luxurians FD-317 M1]|uniref:galacturonan 1,4-alpha-galacturonidase n=1 Tax=Collybiopsis luxurians FD-317 M1 TaxID=944289 RepID=A0A0D0CBS0_9AGAR|nr:glycoside hydrolase family 28 protein [Collybiopsis luxurians FD-317 M1]
MRGVSLLSKFFSLLALLTVSEASAVAKRGAQTSEASCTLKASGGDDAPQFLAAAASCSTVTIPVGTTLNIETRLNMTGLSNLNINLQGTIRFDPNIPYWTGNGFFIPFQTQITFWLLGGKNIVLSGGGTLDGAGQAWYDAFASNSSLLRPIILTLNQANNAVVENIRMINSPEWFNLVNECNDVTFNNITINAVSTSKNFISNTDGWDIYRSDSVTIKNSVINNGDDCVSFKPNSTNILVSNLNCNGSHGISVGSLGQFSGVFDIVQNVTAIGIQMSNAENGARIKAFAGDNVGSGHVQNVTFQNFVVNNVDSPVVIDQCYETAASACEEFPSNVVIEDIFFNNISGTGSGSEVASLDCSPDGRCSGINVNNLNLKGAGGKTTFDCQNVVLAGNSASLFGTCSTT